jgi:hypothetical protein
MNQEIIGLERLRQQIEAFRWWAGSTGDYIDHGNPTSQEERDAYNRIEEYTYQNRLLLTQLHEQLVILRSTQPELIEEWCHYHINLCKRILEEQSIEPYQDGQITDHAVRLFVAKETLAEWEKVLKGDQDFVSINSAFLEDYWNQISALVEITQND